MTELAVSTVESGVLVVSLDEHRDRIMNVLERTALDIGAELLGAKQDHPGEFVEWVETKLPFGIDKAERLMAITRCFATVDETMRSALPPAWTALYELTRLPAERLAAAVASGAVHPSMTVIEARVVGSDQQAIERPTPEPAAPNERGTRLSCDIVARELTRYPRRELSPTMRAVLTDWLRPTPEGEDG